MGLQAFERRLERLVEGAFTKAFRSGLQPLEIGRRIVRELDAGRTVGVHGVVAPNHFTVVMSPEDFERFASFRDALARELADAAREHARDERYHFVGPVVVELTEDPQRRQGDLRVDAVIEQGEGGWAASLVLADGSRVALGEDDATIGRLPDCAVALSDPQVSRHHAQLRRSPEGYRVVDLGSTNGTTVNGTAVADHLLRDGDTIGVGNTEIRFEES
jgi:FHA domain-containing protein